MFCISDSDDDPPMRHTASVQANGGLICPRAVIAEPDTGLIVIRHGGPDQAIFAQGLGHSIAVMLRASGATGLLHTQLRGTPLSALIHRAVAEFHWQTGKRPAVSLGYSRSGLRRELQFRARALAAQVTAVRDRRVDHALNQDQRRVERIGRKHQAPVVEIPDRALLLQPGLTAKRLDSPPGSCQD